MAYCLHVYGLLFIDYGLVFVVYGLWFRVLCAMADGLWFIVYCLGFMI